MNRIDGDASKYAELFQVRKLRRFFSGLFYFLFKEGYSVCWVKLNIIKDLNRVVMILNILKA